MTGAGAPVTGTTRRPLRPSFAIGTVRVRAGSGDEVVGIEVIRRVLERLDVMTVRGTLIAVPIVNVLGTMTGDRYLPGRRDLNRSFPGSARGSLAGRIAHLIMQEVVAQCDVGIGQHVKEGDRLGELYNSFGRRLAIVKADRDGVVIGRSEAPLVNRGDALVHIGEITSAEVEAPEQAGDSEPASGSSSNEPPPGSGPDPDARDTGTP